MVKTTKIISLVLIMTILTTRIALAAIASKEVQTNSVNASASSIAFPSMNIAIGDMVIICAKWENNVNASSVTDTAGNTFTGLTQGNNSGTNGEPHAKLFYSYATSANATDVITINFSAGAIYKRVIAHSFTGLDSTPFDTEPAVGQATSGTGLSTGTFSTAQAEELIYSCEGGYNTLTYSNPLIGGVSATQESLVGADTTGHYLVTSAIQSSITANITQSISNRWTIVAAAFKAPAAPVTSTPEDVNNFIMFN